MRDLLTGLAVALILLLAAALAGPLLVDWNARRPLVEGELSRALGQRVTVGGAISLRLLPTPVLRVADLAVGENSAAPVLSAENLSLEIAAVSLLRGEIRVLDATIDGGRLNLKAEADGRVVPAGALRPITSSMAIAVDRFLLRRSTLVVADELGGNGFLFTGIDVEAQAGALTGPWRVTGRAALNGRLVDVRLSTGAVEADGGFRTRLALIGNENNRVDFDGHVATGDVPGLDGRLTLTAEHWVPSPAGPVERRMSALSRVQSTGRTLTLDGIEMDSGEDSGIKLTGSGTFALAQSPKLTLDLDARAVDLDKPLGTGLATPLPKSLEAWVDALSRNAVPQGRLAVALRLEVPSLLIGGDSLRDVSVRLEWRDGRLQIDKFNAGLPGQSTVETKGQLTFADGLQFAGPLTLVTRDAPRLFGWLEGQPGGRSARLGATKDASFSGDVSLAGSIFGARVTALSIDRSNLSGVFRYTGAEADRRARVEAQLASDGFVIDELPDLSQVTSGLAGADLSLALDARNVRLAKAGFGAGRLLLHVDADREGLVIDRAELVEVAGASVVARGRIGPGGGRLNVSIDAKRAEPIAELLRRLVASPVTEMLSRRAPDLGPLRLELVVEREGGETSPIQLNLKGDAAGTALSGAGDWVPGKSGLSGLKMQLVAANPDVPMLLRQMGAETLPLPLGGAGRLALDLDLRTSKALMILGLPGAGLDADLTLAQDAMSGAIRLDGEDIGPVMQVLGMPVPDMLQKLPAQLSANVRLTETALGLSGLKGSVAGTPVSGRLDARFNPAQIKADFAVDTIALTDIASLTLGPIAPPAAGSIWPAQRFVPVPPPLFMASVDLKAQKLELPLGITAEGAVMALSFTPDRFDLKLSEAKYAGGGLFGTLALRRTGGRVGLTGNIGMRGVPLAALVPEGAPLSGTADLDLDGGATGESLVGFVSSASGAGRLIINKPRVEKLDPRAPILMATQFDLAQEVPDTRRLREATTRALDVGPFLPRAVETALTLSNGVFKSGAFTAENETGKLQGTLSFDAKNGRLEARSILFSSEPQPGLGGVVPELGVVWRASPGKPVEREINVAALANFLTSRAVQRDLERIQAFEADVRERSFFQRRLRLDREHIDRLKREADDAAAASEAIRILGGTGSPQPSP